MDHPRDLKPKEEEIEWPHKVGLNRASEMLARFCFVRFNMNKKGSKRKAPTLSDYASIKEIFYRLENWQPITRDNTENASRTNAINRWQAIAINLNKIFPKNSIKI